MNGLSSPTTTFSQSGHALAKISSNSFRNLSALFPISFSTSPLFPPVPPPDPIPGIQPAGAMTTEANASGMIKSRSLSPADNKFLPSELAARVPFCRGAVKLEERSVRCVVSDWFDWE